MPIGLGIGLNISMRGGLGSGFSLTAPELAFASATDPDSDNTQDLDVDITEALGSNVIRLVGTFGSATVSEPYDVDATGTDGDLDQNISFTTGAIPDGVCSFKCRIEDGSGNALSDWSNTASKTIDATAPTITSSNAINQAENAAFSHTLTANESVTWTKTGGADTALFTLAGSNLSMTAKDYETPADADTNNTYVVQVTATDAAGNATNQTITITVTDVAEGSAEANQYISRTSNLTGGEETALRAFIDGLVADGLWTKLDWLHVYALGTAADAVLNLKSSSYPASPQNSPTFTAGQGYTGNGSNMYLDTGFNPSTAGGQYAQNSASAFAYSRIDNATTIGILGNTNAASQVYISPRFSASAFFGINGSTITPAHTGGTGFYHCSRRGNTDIEYYEDGTSFATSATASSALQNNNMTTLRASGSYSTGQVSLAGAGAGMDDTEAANLAARVATLKTALGF